MYDLYILIFMSEYGEGNKLYPSIHIETMNHNKNFKLQFMENQNKHWILYFWGVLMNKTYICNVQIKT